MNLAIPKILTIAMLALLPYACSVSIERAERAELMQCLSWQADGHDVRCLR